MRTIFISICLLMCFWLGFWVIPNAEHPLTAFALAGLAAGFLAAADEAWRRRDL